MKTQGEAGDIDLRQFQVAFFEEAAEHLAEMESLLVRMDLAAATGEDLDAIFRAAHSIKGGSGMFGFTDMTTLTHELESLLDRVRKRELLLTPGMVDVLLQSSDLLREQLDHYNGRRGVPATSVEAMCRTIRDCQCGVAPHGAAASPLRAAAAPALATRVLTITVPPDAARELTADLAEQLREIGEFSEIAAPPARRKGRKTATARSYRLVTTSTADVVRTLFEFVMDAAKVTIEETPGPTARAGENGDRASMAAAADETPAASDAGADEASRTGDTVGYGFFVPVPVGAGSEHVRMPAGPATPKAESRAVEGTGNAETSIRVSVEKVDQLINQVGELVITQAMLAQCAGRLDGVLHEKLLAGMADLERNTRDLQESVMSIRMLPIAFVFNRFPRLVRDLATKLGKEVRLVTEGEETELDKGLIERISDPLTHLVRNAIDHGVEPTSARLAAGKPAFGTITLRAVHRGANILIEVADDGAGLDRERILAKAHERDIAVSNAMSDTDVWNLIFEPGFSTAQAVTDVSGRGVGMDVVRRNIASLSGSVEIASMPGIGTRMTIRLPLTLAIMDGMSVAVGNEVYILPLASIVESLQVAEGQVRSIAGHGRVIDVRGEYLPVVSLHDWFVNGPARGERASGTMVVVECDGVKAALLVDELLGQHQVVVKSLEANYRKVGGISGATIMGDGRVALILDVATLTRRMRDGT